MHIAIRRYKTDSAAEVTRQVTQGFVPLISNLPGFVAYYGIEAGPDVWASVSVFETAAEAEESSRLAADWRKKNKDITHLAVLTEIFVGKVIAHKMK